MNLFTGLRWRHRHREQTYGHGQGEERGMGRMERVSLVLVEHLLQSLLDKGFLAGRITETLVV